MHEEAPDVDRVYWVGPHAHFRTGSGRALNTPLGRLPRATLAWLRDTHGWREVSPTNSIFPLLCFLGKNAADAGDVWAARTTLTTPSPVKSGSNSPEVFSGVGGVLFPVFQFASTLARPFEDKLEFWRRVKRNTDGAFLVRYLPATWEAADVLPVRHLPPTWETADILPTTSEDAPALHPTTSEDLEIPLRSAVLPENDPVSESQRRPDVVDIDASALHFVKHRHGSCGRAVHVVGGGLAGARIFLSGLRSSKRERTIPDFVIQRQVSTQRPHVVRVHVLVVLRAGHGANRVDPEVYVHDEAILVLYGPNGPTVTEEQGNYTTDTEFEVRDPTVLASLISSRALRTSSFAVLTEESLENAALVPRTVLQEKSPFESVQAQIRLVARRCVDAVLWSGASGDDEGRGLGRSGTVQYQLLGADFLISSEGALVLLEFNTNPAIASGTMKDAPKDVYDRMTRDMICRLLPVVAGEEGSSTPWNGFVAVSTNTSEGMEVDEDVVVAWTVVRM